LAVAWARRIYPASPTKTIVPAAGSITDIQPRLMGDTRAADCSEEAKDVSVSPVLICFGFFKGRLRAASAHAWKFSPEP